MLKLSLFLAMQSTMLGQIHSSGFQFQWYGGSLIISCPFAFAKSCSVFETFVAVMLAQISSSGMVAA